MLDSNDSNLIQNLRFGSPSRDTDTNTESTNAGVNYVFMTKRSKE